MVLVEGRLCTRKWTDPQGVERVSTEVVVDPRGNCQLRLLGGRSAAGRSTAQPGGGSDRMAERPVELAF